ncbi:hypothetical protein BU202_02065 [Streptococcus cuniculi]|uniref:Uncharacterized protein n=1 Tax=Streptococcus cuniculi TaxID=1432788 RepID=A0A1Q8E9F2_9STRE|nr:Imm59 family immunity protein [Streptococcus cuniculi]OLF48423.1 hypothetical protein BU202_02065 [Streptococcus cuniculi]
MINFELEKKNIVDEIKNKGYESLRYSIFSDHRPLEWEIRLEFDNKNQLYLVYATMDRASYNKKLEFDNFKDAKACFMEKLELTVKSNKLNIQLGLPSEYPSPLWDKTK